MKVRAVISVLFIASVIFMAEARAAGPTGEDDLCRLSFEELKLPKGGALKYGKNEFSEFSQSSPVLGRVQKFVVLMDEKGEPARVVFMNTRSFPFHSQFVRYLSGFKDLPPMAIDHLAQQGQRLVYGTFIDDGQSVIYDLYTHRFLGRPQLQALEKHLQSQLAFDELPQRYSALRGRGSSVPIAGVVAKAALTKVLHSGKVSGELKVLNRAEYESAFRKGEITRDHIIALDFIPEDLPPVAGVILPREVAPTSHLVMLSHSLDIPLVVDPEAVTSLKNGKVILEAGEKGGVSIRTQFSDEEFAAHRRAIRVRSAAAQPKVDHSATEIVDLSKLDLEDLAGYGGKAAQLAHAAKVIPDAVLDSLGIPVSHFRNFLLLAKTADGKSLGTLIEKELGKISDPNTSVSKTLISLANIRRWIDEAEIPEEALEPIRAALAKKYPPGTKLIFRSSNTAEDLADFNGAGLYDSVTGDLKTLGASLKKVWKSQYNDRAYLARREFGIDESRVAMGVLVQPYRADLEMNGVAIFSGDKLHLDFLKGQAELVVRADATELPTSHTISYASDGRPILEPHSDLPPPVQQQLGTYAKKLGTAWISNKKTPELDIEWGVVPDKIHGQKTMIFQVRRVPSRNRAPAGHYLTRVQAKGPKAKKMPQSMEMATPQFSYGSQAVLVERLQLMGPAGDLDLSNLKLPYQLRKNDEIGPHLYASTRLKIEGVGDVVLEIEMPLPFYSLKDVKTGPLKIENLRVRIRDASSSSEEEGDSVLFGVSKP